MKKLKTNLKSLLRKEHDLIDIYIFGSALKEKDVPEDIDVLPVFRNRNYEKIEEVTYLLAKLGSSLGLKLHVEPVVIDDLYSQKIYPSVLHEGFSIKQNDFLRNIIKFKSHILFKYDLINKSASDKVRFSYALYGRKKGEGFLKEIGGLEVGRGSFLSPVEKQELTRSFFREWDVKFEEQRIGLFG